MIRIQSLPEQFNDLGFGDSVMLISLGQPANKMTPEKKSEKTSS
jgi:hypothetical protein